jgi:hypothetical protein
MGVATNDLIVPGGQFMAARVVPVTLDELPALHGLAVLFVARLGW